MDIAHAFFLDLLLLASHTRDLIPHLGGIHVGQALAAEIVFIDGIFRFSEYFAELIDRL